MPAYQPPRIEEKEQYVRALFDRIAGHYDRVNRVMSAGRWRSWQRTFAQRAAFAPGHRVLDLACGTGDLTLLAAESVAPNGGVVGVDFSDGMLAVARRRVAASGRDAIIELRSGNVLALDFPDASFDIATMGWATRNVRDIAASLAEVRRVLRPGGRFLNLDAARPRNPLVRLGFDAWWKAAIPAIDRLVVKAGGEAAVRPYTYLAHSLDEHPDVARLAELFRDAGFVDVGYTTLNWGTVSIHWGTAPVRSTRVA